MKRFSSSLITFVFTLALMTPTSGANALGDRSASGFQVTSGYSHSCASVPSRTPVCWGLGSSGQTTPPSSMGNDTELATGAEHTCALNDLARVICWGSNSFGESTVPTDLDQIVQISAGFGDTCVLNNYGSVRCWGFNAFGETQVPSNLGKVIQLSTSAYHTCALTIAKEVRCWGYDLKGQADVPSGLGAVKKVVAGWDHTCALLTSGLVSCWGDNSYGQLEAPMGLVNVIDISLGSAHTCGLTSSNSVICWGYDNHGQTDIPVDLGNVLAISAGGDHTCVFTSAGSYRCWGYSPNGETRVPANLQNVFSDANSSSNQNIPISSVLTCQYSFGADHTYVWLRNGLVIGHRCDTYTVTLADLGSRITLQMDGQPWMDWTISADVPGAGCVGTPDQSIWQTTGSGQPSISGTPNVGSVLKMSKGAWPVGTTNFCMYWYMSGQSVGAGSSYKIQASDIGQWIQAVVVGSDKKGKAALRFSDAVEIVPTKFPNPSAPTINGNLQVGTKLTVKIPRLWSAGVQYSYSWLRDGTVILGGVNSSYDVTADDVGTTLSVQVCGAKPSFETYCTVAYSVGAATSGIIKPTPIPKLQASKLAVGSLVTGLTGSWPQGVGLSFQWFRDDLPLIGENSLTHAISQADRGHTLSLQVRAKKKGYLEVVMSSPSRAIP